MSEFINPHNKLFKHLDKLDAMQHGKVVSPVNVEIDLSNRCSLGCQWCHFAYTHTRGPNTGNQEKPEGAIIGGDLMAFDLALSILKQLQRAGVNSVTWSGGGEPTLHPEFNNIISSCYIDQGVYTNGTNINLLRAKTMKAACKWVYVSLDAADSEDYLRDKGSPLFGKVCQAIEDLAHAEGQATIGVGFLLTRKNWRKYPQMADLGKKLGADYVQFRPTILFNEKRPNKLNEDTHWMQAMITEIKSIQRIKGIEIDVTRFWQYMNWARHGYPTCYWSGLQTVITPNGKMWACCNKRENPGALLGDLNDELFEEIWKRREFNAVDKDCRVMCRGHLMNLVLDPLMRASLHDNFI